MSFALWLTYYIFRLWRFNKRLSAMLIVVQHAEYSPVFRQCGQFSTVSCVRHARNNHPANNHKRMSQNRRHEYYNAVPPSRPGQTQAGESPRTTGSLGSGSIWRSGWEIMYPLGKRLSHVVTFPNDCCDVNLGPTLFKIQWYGLWILCNNFSNLQLNQNNTCWVIWRASLHFVSLCHHLGPPTSTHPIEVWSQKSNSPFPRSRTTRASKMNEIGVKVFELSSGQYCDRQTDRHTDTHTHTHTEQHDNNTLSQCSKYLRMPLHWAG